MYRQITLTYSSVKTADIHVTSLFISRICTIWGMECALFCTPKYMNCRHISGLLMFVQYKILCSSICVVKYSNIIVILFIQIGFSSLYLTCMFLIMYDTSKPIELNLESSLFQNMQFSIQINIGKSQFDIGSMGLIQSFLKRIS